MARYSSNQMLMLLMRPGGVIRAQSSQRAPQAVITRASPVRLITGRVASRAISTRPLMACSLCCWAPVPGNHPCQRSSSGTAIASAIGVLPYGDGEFSAGLSTCSQDCSRSETLGSGLVLRRNSTR